MLRFLNIVLLVGFFLVSSAPSLLADDLKSSVRNLEIIPVAYGVNELQVARKDLRLIRGQFETEGTAWGGDIYIALVRINDVWKIARHEQNSSNSVLLTTIPHTHEDSVKTLRFLASPSKTAPEKLYVLEAARKYAPFPKKSPVEFTLFELSLDSEFSIPLFLKKTNLITTRSYCNVDIALNKELDIPLPQDGFDYSCSSATE